MSFSVSVVFLACVALTIAQYNPYSPHPPANARDPSLPSRSSSTYNRAQDFRAAGKTPGYRSSFTLPLTQGPNGQIQRANLNGGSAYNGGSQRAPAYNGQQEPALGYGSTVSQGPLSYNGGADAQRANSYGNGLPYGDQQVGGYGDMAQPSPDDPDGDSIVGVAGSDYPTYSEVPMTSFGCSQQQFPGLYADTEAQCQVFHICQDGGHYDSFLCPNGSIFNQQYFVCDWWYNVDCQSAPSFYGLNADLYKDVSQYGAPGAASYGADFAPGSFGQRPSAAYGPIGQAQSSAYGNGREHHGASPAYGNGRGLPGASPAFGNGRGYSGPSPAYGNGRAPTGVSSAYGNGRAPAGVSPAYDNGNGRGGFRSSAAAYDNGMVHTGPSSTYGNGNGRVRSGPSSAAYGNGSGNGRFGPASAYGNGNGRGSSGASPAYGNGNGNGRGSSGASPAYGNGNGNGRGSSGASPAYGNGNGNGRGSSGASPAYGNGSGNGNGNGRGKSKAPSAYGNAILASGPRKASQNGNKQQLQNDDYSIVDMPPLGY